MSQHENDETDNESIDEFAELSRPAFEEKQRKTKADREAEKQQKMQEKIAKREQKEMLKQAAAEEKAAKKAAKQKPSVVEQEPEQVYLGDIDGEQENETEILGRDKRTLLAKIGQFKELFENDNPKIKKFKVKKNASVEELQNTITELECIIEIDSCNTFMVDSILQCITLIEGVSANTRNYNVSGLTSLLRANKEFHRLTKLLFIKYGCFTSCPPEAQLLLLVATTAYICKSKNTNKEQINNFLNMPV